MVTISAMVFEFVIPTEEDGRADLTQAHMTDHVVRKLFEKAVGNALKIVLGPKGWDIKPGRKIKWPVARETSGLRAILPEMETDIELFNKKSGRKIVIDTKFTNIIRAGRWDTEKLKSGYLYQLYAYLRTQETEGDHVSLHSEGMLLHPQVGGHFDEEMELQHHKMRFRTIDLSATPTAFETSLRNLVQ